ncbi:hypothetical protein PIB30_098746, partial [Stylosanthes scabra]|nr:hypothetical protein [Stylosanthes scabra]
KLEDALTEWRKSIESRKKVTKLKSELLRAKIEKCKAQEYDPYSIEICMDILEGIEDIPSAIYNERKMEDDFIAKGVHISDSVDIDLDEHVQRSDEKRKQNDSPSRRHGKKQE